MSAAGRDRVRLAPDVLRRGGLRSELPMVDRRGASLADEPWLEELACRFEAAHATGESLALEPIVAERPHLRPRIIVLRDIVRGPRHAEPASRPQVEGFEI